MTAFSGKTIALILAGRREGPPDPLEAASGAAHKALIDIGGKPMVSHVLDALAGVVEIGPVWIAGPADLEESLRGSSPHPFEMTAADAGSPAASIGAALREAPRGAQFLVTTCDHPLLTPSIVAEFLSSVDRTGSDVAAGCVTRGVYDARYAGTRRTFIRFKDVQFSGANLFWFRAGAADPLIDFWRALEAERKNPAAMAKKIGVMTGLYYFFGALTQKRAMETIAKKTGVRASLVRLSQAEAAIDVDKPEDLDLVRKIFNARVPSS